MLNVATISTNNPVLILGAFALNGLYRVALVLIAAVFAVAAVIEWLSLSLLEHWRIVAMLAGLVAAVVLVAVFWQVILVGAGVLGGMYAGLLAVVRL